MNLRNLNHPTSRRLYSVCACVCEAGKLVVALYRESEHGLVPSWDYWFKSQPFSGILSLKIRSYSEVFRSWQRVYLRKPQPPAYLITNNLFFIYAVMFESNLLYVDIDSIANIFGIFYLIENYYSTNLSAW